MSASVILPPSKIITSQQAGAWRESIRSDRRRLALTNGCFDLLHRGHAEYLLAARSLADALVVLINSDASVRALKGPSRPVTYEYDRAYLLACFSFVDAVMIFDSKRCTQQIDLLQPDVYVKGGDYTVDTLDPEERAALFRVHADIRFIPFVPGHSTTSILQKVSARPV